MPPLARVGVDTTTGHPPYPPVTFTTGSNTVYCNNSKVVVLGSMHPPHGCPDPKAPMPQYLTGGSSNVLIESKPAGRLGDMDSCPECISSGSGNVICN